MNTVFVHLRDSAKVEFLDARILKYGGQEGMDPLVRTRQAVDQAVIRKPYGQILVHLGIRLPLSSPHTAQKHDAFLGGDQIGEIDHFIDQ